MVVNNEADIQLGLIRKQMHQEYLVAIWQSVVNQVKKTSTTFSRYGR